MLKIHLIIGPQLIIITIKINSKKMHYLYVNGKDLFFDFLLT